MASSDITRPSRRRTPAQIESDLEAARNRLATSIEELIDEVHPNRIKQRTVDRVRAIVRGKIDEAKNVVVDEDGELRTERVAAFAAAFGGVITFFIVVNRIRHRGRKK